MTGCASVKPNLVGKYEVDFLYDRDNYNQVIWARDSLNKSVWNKVLVVKYDSVIPYYSYFLVYKIGENCFYYDKNGSMPIFADISIPENVASSFLNSFDEAWYE